MQTLNNTQTSLEKCGPLLFSSMHKPKRKLMKFFVLLPLLTMPFCHASRASKLLWAGKLLIMNFIPREMTIISIIIPREMSINQWSSLARVKIWISSFPATASTAVSWSLTVVPPLTYCHCNHWWLNHVFSEVCTNEILYRTRTQFG